MKTSTITDDQGKKRGINGSGNLQEVPKKKTSKEIIKGKDEIIEGLSQKLYFSNLNEINKSRKNAYREELLKELEADRDFYTVLSILSLGLVVLLSIAICFFI